MTLGNESFSMMNVSNHSLIVVDTIEANNDIILERHMLVDDLAIINGLLDYQIYGVSKKKNDKFFPLFISEEGENENFQCRTKGCTENKDFFRT